MRIATILTPALAAAAVLLTVPAAAQSTGALSDAQMFNVKIGPNSDYDKGTPLDSATGPTNPLFTVALGSKLFFGVAVTSSKDDTFTAFWSQPGQGYTLSNADVNGRVSYPISARGGNTYFETLTFTRLGELTIQVLLNMTLANPDYRFSSDTAAREAPSFTFRVNVVDPNAVTPAVPEPATWAMMLLGFGLVARMVRSRGRGRRTRRVFA